MSRAFFFPKKDRKRIGSIESKFLEGGVFCRSHIPSYNGRRPTNCPSHSFKLDFSRLQMLGYGQDMFAPLPARVLNSQTPGSGSVVGGSFYFGRCALAGESRPLGMSPQGYPIPSLFWFQSLLSRQHEAIPMFGHTLWLIRCSAQVCGARQSWTQPSGTMSDINLDCLQLFPSGFLHFGHSYAKINKQFTSE